VVRGPQGVRALGAVRDAAWPQHDVPHDRRRAAAVPGSADAEDRRRLVPRRAGAGLRPAAQHAGPADGVRGRSVAVLPRQRLAARAVPRHAALAVGRVPAALGRRRPARAAPAVATVRARRLLAARQRVGLRLVRAAVRDQAMGVMKLEALVDLVERLWRARWLGWALVLAYAALVGKGWRDGLRDIGDIDAQVRVRLNYVHTATRDIEAVGRGTLFTVRHDGLRAVLIGPCELRISCRDAEQAMLSMEVGWENARLGDSFRIEDAATGAVHVLDNLVVHHSGLMIPLPKATTTLRFTPSVPALGLRIHGLKLLTGVPLLPFAVDVQWEVVHQDATAGVALGTGFWPRSPGRLRLETRRFAYLRIDAA